MLQKNVLLRFYLLLQNTPIHFLDAANIHTASILYIFFAFMAGRMFGLGFVCTKHFFTDHALHCLRWNTFIQTERTFIYFSSPFWWVDYLCSSIYFLVGEVLDSGL